MALGGAVNLEDDVLVTGSACEVLGTVPRNIFWLDERGAVAPIGP